MADEVVITPNTEVKEVKEGTVESEIVKNQEVVAPPIDDKKPDEAAPETVPLRVYLDLKDDLKNLKQEIKDAGSNRSTVQIQGLDELTKKYPDVNSEFIQDMLSSATKEATSKIEAKYAPIIERQDAEKKQAAFDTAFDALYTKTLQDNPELPKNIDKDAIKALALTSKYRNVPLVEILTKLYRAEESGKGASENDARSGADTVDDVVSFDNITTEQKTRIMADEKTRKAYFNWLDTQPGR